MHALQRLAGVGAEALAQVAAVALEALQGDRRPADRRLGAQQVSEQGLVVRPGGVAASSSGRTPAWAPIRLAARASVSRAAPASAAAARRTWVSGPPSGVPGSAR